MLNYIFIIKYYNIIIKYYIIVIEFSWDLKKKFKNRFSYFNKLKNFYLLLNYLLKTFNISHVNI